MGGELWETSLMLLAELLVLIIVLFIMHMCGWITITIHWDVIWGFITHIRITFGG